jgi:putative endonuclease
MTVARQNLGHGGEDMAAAYLQASGYRILARNYRTRLGEIDIVARDGNILVFVEVKVRRTPSFGSAKDAITAAKRRRLSMLALQYLKSPAGRRYTKARFDVVAVDRQAADQRIDQVQNAIELAYP